MSKKDMINELEQFKDLIDSRTIPEKEKEEDRKALLAAREKRFKIRPESEKIAAELLQLKYQMENFLKDPVPGLENNFSKFLSIYIDILYRKRKNFAADIDINPIVLSQIINNHRQPTEEFLIRLVLHSQAVFKKISSFEKELWPKLYFQDRISEFLTSTEKKRKLEEKHVKKKVLDF